MPKPCKSCEKIVPVLLAAIFNFMFDIVAADHRTY